MHHSYYLYSVLPVFMALPQAHHILPPSQLPVPYRISLHNLSLQRNGEIMIFLQSCHARKDASLTVKWKPKNRKRNVRFRAEDQDNTLCSVHSSFWGYFSFNFLKCTSRVRPNANPFLRQRKSPPACLGTDLQHIPSACVWEHTRLAAFTWVWVCTGVRLHPGARTRGGGAFWLHMHMYNTSVWVGM